MSLFKKYILIILSIFVFSSSVGAIAQDYFIIEPTNVQKQSKLIDLVPNHNNRSADRLNLIFVLDDFNAKNNEYLEENLQELIGWNGARLSKEYSNQLRLNIGFFSSDPIMNFKDKFNIYYIKDKSVLNNSAINTFGFDKEMLIYIKITSTSYNNLSGTMKVQDYSTGSKNYNRISLNLDSGYNTSFSKYQNVLAHELGHAIFGLTDEYLNAFNDINPDGNKPREFPNCILDKDKALENWNKFLNTIDSEVSYLESQYARINSKLFDWSKLKDKYRTQLIQQECQRTELKKDNTIIGYKPTKSGIMESTEEHIVWGSVNKNQVIKVLDSFAGTGKNIPNNRKEFTQQEIDYANSRTYDQLEIEPRNKFGMNIIRPSTLDNPIFSNSEKIRMFFVDNYIYIALLLTVIIVISNIVKKRYLIKKD